MASKRLLVLLLAVPVALPAQQLKPATASAAVEEYIRAASDSNLTRMGQLFGTDKGSAVHIKLPELERRMVITHAYLARTVVKAISEVATDKSNERLVTTEIARGSCKVVMPVIAVHSARDGWLVRNLDLDRAKEVNRPCDDTHGGNF